MSKPVTEARDDFVKLLRMREVLGYPLTIFINIDSDETHVAQRPEAIAGQSACYAVRHRSLFGMAD